MTPRDRILLAINTLFHARQKEWDTQGRTADDRWALQNFLSGQGFLLVEDLVDLVEREIEDAELTIAGQRKLLRERDDKIAELEADYRILWKKYEDMHHAD